MSRLGIVAIARNEGERLIRCLGSCCGTGLAVVYVDSGSTDGSVERARAMGAEVVELDLSTPFTHARARNVGFERLEQIAPGIEMVQFVDGDCEIAAGWLATGMSILDARPDVGVVAGRRRERYPEATLYNRLADLEWDTPLGEVSAVGGDAMVRTSVFHATGGYDPTLINGEDPDFYLRIRRAGWKILRVDAEMTVHDMAMTQFGQWWRRSVRTGYGYAEGAIRHGAGPERYRVRETRGIAFWGLAMPAISAVAAWPTWGLSLLAPVLGYPALFLKTRRYYRRDRGWSERDARLFAAACVLGKFPQTIGAARYVAGRLSGRPSGIIEYRRPVATPSGRNGNPEVRDPGPPTTGSGIHPTHEH